MNKLLKRNIILILTIFIALASLLFVANFCDLEIAKSIYIGDNVFSDIMEVVGELPLFLILPFSFFVIAVYFKEKNNLKVSFVAIAFIVFGVLSVYVTIQRYLDGVASFFLIMVICLISSILFLCLADLLPKHLLASLGVVASFSIIIILVGLGANQSIKILWGRTRFCEMLLANDLSQFTAWYQPQGMTGHKSFPSGHSFASTIVLLAIPIIRIFTKSKKITIITSACCFSFIILTCVSRMLSGMHFLSDVVVGFELTFIVIAIIYIIFKKQFYLDIFNLQNDKQVAKEVVVNFEANTKS